MSESKSKGPVVMLKYIYSCLLLIFSVVLIVGLIFNRETRLADQAHPWAALIVMLFAITWLTMVEGGQGALVGLGPVHSKYYEKTHPTTKKCTGIIYSGDNLDRYLLGRQFMVILIVFIVELCGAAHGGEHGIHLWNMPNWLITIFCQSGVAMILFTCMVGQLNSEIIGCHYMLDYLNNWFALVTIWVAMAIEFSGILHTAYVVQRSVGYLAGKPIESNEPPKSIIQQAIFVTKCLMSLTLLAFSFAVTMTAILNDQTTVWEGTPKVVSIIMLFVLMGVIGVLEGSQIAYFAVVKMTQEERGEGMFTKKSCEILFKNNNHNLAAFLVGRQLCVVSCMFFIARITAVKLKEDDENIFNVPDWVQGIFNTGLLGAFIVAHCASVAWRLLASAFPLQFMNNPISYIFLRICLALELTGILHGAWVIAGIIKKLTGVKRDEVYIGTAEERAASEAETAIKTVSSFGRPKTGTIVGSTDVGDEPPNPDLCGCW